MKITAEMALRELRRRGKFDGEKDRTEAALTRARADGTLDLSNRKLRSIASGDASRPPGTSASDVAEKPGKALIRSSSAPLAAGSSEDSQVEALIREFRSSHQMVSKAEIRDLRSKLPNWLEKYPKDAVETAIRRGPTVAHVGRLAAQIAAGTSQLTTSKQGKKLTKHTTAAKPGTRKADPNPPNRPKQAATAPATRETVDKDGQVEALIREFRSSHQMVSKAEIRDLRSKLPNWLEKYPKDAVETAIRRGPTVAHVGRLAAQIAAGTTQLTTTKQGKKLTKHTTTAKPGTRKADPNPPNRPKQAATASVRIEAETAGHARPSEAPDGLMPAADSRTAEELDLDSLDHGNHNGGAILQTDAERAIYLRFETRGRRGFGLLGALHGENAEQPATLQHFDLGGCELEATVLLRKDLVDHQTWKSLSPVNAIREVISLSRSQQRPVIAWSADTLFAMLQLDLTDGEREHLRKSFRSGLEIALAWRERQPPSNDHRNKGDSIAAFMTEAGLPGQPDAPLGVELPAEEARAFLTVAANFRRLSELRSLVIRLGLSTPRRDELRAKSSRLETKDASRAAHHGWGKPGVALLPAPLAELLAEDLGVDPSARFWDGSAAEQIADDVLARAVRLSGQRWREVADASLGGWPDRDDLDHLPLAARTADAIRRYVDRVDDPLTLRKLMDLPEVGIRSAIEFACVVEAAGLASDPSLAPDPVVIGALQHIEELPWADGFRSDYISLSVPLSFTSLRREAAALRRKLATRPTRGRLKRAERLLTLAARVEEFNSLDLQEAAGRVLSYAAPTAESEQSLHAFIGLGDWEPGNTTAAAAAGGISRQRFLRVRSALSRSSAHRVWLPQLKGAIARLEDPMAARTAEPAEIAAVSAIASLLGSDGDRRRVERIDEFAGLRLRVETISVDIEHELRRMAEPYGFVRVSDAIDELHGLGATTNLPGLQSKLAELSDAQELSEGWWWLSRSVEDPPLAVRVATNVAYAAHRPFTGGDLSKAFARHVGGIRHGDQLPLPDGDVLAVWAEAVRDLRVDDEGLIYTNGEPRDEMLGEVELSVVETVALSQGGVCSTDQLLAELSESAGGKSSGVADLDRLAIVEQVRPNVWALCGAEFDPQIADLLSKGSS